MKMPLKWAQNFADFSCTPQEFADKMTMSGSKVETFGSQADNITNVVVGRIDSLEKHPDADTLWVCQVNIGTETIQIVTGAQNLKVGDFCPAALHGAKLPNGTEIRRGKLRGEVSNGMLCSLDELGLTQNDFPNANPEGILVLELPAEPGSPAASALGMDDVTFEFEITPNRPDCLSIRGLAREAAATFGVPFIDIAPKIPTGNQPVTDLLKVQVEDKLLCHRYTAAMVDNVRIQPSPGWMRERLRQAGVRPINNIVDITNYVMLEYGQPMHAFDSSYVEQGSITVRRAKQGESIVTLDDIQRELDEDMLVIADPKGPIAVAGVMGGEYSGVYETTKKVVFESASFDGPSVRNTSRRLGLRTESSGRFEKGLDPENVLPALQRALELVAELDAGDIMNGMVDVYPAPRQTRTLPLREQPISNLLGIEVSKEEIQDILLPLGFKVEDGLIQIPSWRGDVQQDCDIAEEVARFIGYNKIPSTSLQGTASALPSELQQFHQQACETLTGYGFWECETFSFYSPKAFDLIGLPADSRLRHPVKIMNPLGEDTSVMRTTALPSMMEVVSRNWASRNDECALFELATEYLPNPNPDNLPHELKKMILAAYGPDWDYLTLKGAVEGLLSTFDILEFQVKRNQSNPSYHPGRCADLYVVLENSNSGIQGDLLLATLGEVHPNVTSAYSIRPRVVAAEINMEVLFAARGGTPQFQQLPKFPAITRDLALVADIKLPAADIADIIRKSAGKRLEKLELFDVYTGEKLGKDKKSLAYSLILRDSSATLTDQQADAITNKILKSLASIEVVLRS